MVEYFEVSPNTPLKSFCRNATNREGDTFVGFKSEFTEDNKHLLSIHFPIGYKISEDEEVLRDEIIGLISLLQVYNDQQSRITKILPEQVLKTVSFPVQAYFIVMFDFLNNGYFTITEEQFKQGISGSINWARTIKLESPIPQPNGMVYPKYRVKRYSETDKDLITEISKYCVYQSFLRLGWIYKLSLPEKPQGKRDIEIYRNYLEMVHLKANKDKDKRLFSAMIDILNFENTTNEPDEIYFGTNKFEYIWERLIQETYGNVQKEYYFPKTKWLLNFGLDRDNAALEPDTIMKEAGDVYILDAKYYKYGITQIPFDLPNSSSINKQISYGEYVHFNEKFKEERQNGMEVYNAFIMPYDSSQQPYDETADMYYSIGEAISTWKESDKNYQRVQGILVDVKHLISNKIRPSTSEIIKLSESIKNSIASNDKLKNSSSVN